MVNYKLAKVRAEIERRRNRHSKAKRIESALEDNAILSFIDSMQEESKVCMYSTANYTNADRLTLCKDCEELCKYNQKTAAESLGISQEAYDEIVDKCLYGSEVELVDDGDLPKEESVSEDLETEIERVRKHHFINDDFDKVELDGRTISNIAHHFVNWQKQQMMANAVNGFVIEDIEEVNGDFLLSAEYLSKYMRLKDRQKVKVIVIKEN